MQIIFAAPFLLAGCAAFIGCVAIPQLRRFTLPASLWCVSCGPCILAAFLIFLLAKNGVAAIGKSLFHSDFTKHFDSSSKGAILLDCTVVLVAISAATAITVVHGWILRRITLNLFRVYLTGVTIGVGILIAMIVGVVSNIRIQSLQRFYPYLYAPLLLLIPGFLAFFVYPRAKEFRSHRPEYLNPVTPEEFG